MRWKELRPPVEIKGTGGGVASPSAKGTGQCPPTSGSTSNALREEIAQLEAQKAKLHEEAKEKTAQLAARAKAQQEVTEFEEAEAAQKAGLEAEASAKASQEAERTEKEAAWMLEVHALK